VQIKLHESINNNFEYCQLRMPFSNRFNSFFFLFFFFFFFSYNKNFDIEESLQMLKSHQRLEQFIFPKIRKPLFGILVLFIYLFIFSPQVINFSNQVQNFLVEIEKLHYLELYIFKRKMKTKINNFTTNNLLKIMIHFVLIQMLLLVYILKY